MAENAAYIFDSSKLLRAMTRKGVFPVDLAFRLQMRSASVNAWLRGESDPRLSNYLELCFALNLHPMALLTKVERQVEGRHEKAAAQSTA